VVCLEPFCHSGLPSGKAGSFWGSAGPAPDDNMAPLFTAGWTGRMGMAAQLKGTRGYRV